MLFTDLKQLALLTWLANPADALLPLSCACPICFCWVRVGFVQTNPVFLHDQSMHRTQIEVIHMTEENFKTHGIAFKDSKTSGIADFWSMSSPLPASKASNCMEVLVKICANEGISMEKALAASTMKSCERAKGKLTRELANVEHQIKRCRRTLQD